MVSNIIINNCTFKNISTILGSIAHLKTLSITRIKVYNSVFENITAFEKAAGFDIAGDESFSMKIIFMRINFTKILSEKSQGIIYVKSKKKTFKFIKKNKKILLRE